MGGKGQEPVLLLKRSLREFYKAGLGERSGEQVLGGTPN